MLCKKSDGGDLIFCRSDQTVGRIPGHAMLKGVKKEFTGFGHMNADCFKGFVLIQPKDKTACFKEAFRRLSACAEKKRLFFLQWAQNNLRICIGDEPGQQFQHFLIFHGNPLESKDGTSSLKIEMKTMNSTNKY